MGLLESVPRSCIAVNVNDDWYQIIHNSKKAYQDDYWPNDLINGESYQVGFVYTCQDVPEMLIPLMSMAMSSLCHYSSTKSWSDGMIASNGAAFVCIQNLKGHGAFSTNKDTNGVIVICKAAVERKVSALALMRTLHQDMIGYFTLWQKLSPK